jgi:bis(5'-nucleosidyl)-tetraphosphatase
MPHEFSVGIVLFCGNEFLLIRYKAGHWGFAKGKPHTGEKLLDAARREVFEETGIRAVFLVKDFLEKEEYFFRKSGQIVHKEVKYFLAEVQTKDIKLSDEHTEFKWLGFQEAMAQISFQETKNMLKLANDKRTLHG